MKRSTERDYRTSHANKNTVNTYVNAYSCGYFKAQWEQIEKPLLTSIIRNLDPAPKTCLDFACGTGRISAALGEVIPSVVGVDISAEMLSKAEVPNNVRLQQADITRTALGEQFDVCTAFRFFLNAQPRLRIEALHAIRAHLRENGLLIANVHMSSSSPMGVIYRGIKRIKPNGGHRVMGEAEFIDILEKNQFQVQKIYHYSFLPKPGRYFPNLTERAVPPFERLCKRIKLPRRFAQNFCVVAKVDG